MKHIRHLLSICSIFIAFIILSSSTLIPFVYGEKNEYLKINNKIVDNVNISEGMLNILEERVQLLQNHNFIKYLINESNVMFILENLKEYNTNEIINMAFLVEKQLDTINTKYMPIINELLAQIIAIISSIIVFIICLCLYPIGWYPAFIQFFNVAKQQGGSLLACIFYGLYAAVIWPLLVAGMVYLSVYNALTEEIIIQKI